MEALFALTFPTGPFIIDRDCVEEVFAVRVLGIDPGYALMGWGVVDCEGSRMQLVNYGCIETKAGNPMQHRLRTLQLGIRDLLAIYKPDEVAFEELFFARYLLHLRGKDYRRIYRLEASASNRGTIYSVL